MHDRVRKCDSALFVGPVWNSQSFPTTNPHHRGKLLSLRIPLPVSLDIILPINDLSLWNIYFLGWEHQGVMTNKLHLSCCTAPQSTALCTSAYSWLMWGTCHLKIRQHFILGVKIKAVTIVMFPSKSDSNRWEMRIKRNSNHVRFHQKFGLWWKLLTRASFPQVGMTTSL